MTDVLQALETKFQQIVDATIGQALPDMAAVQALAVIKTARSLPSAAPTLSSASLTQVDQFVALSLEGGSKVSIGIKVSSINTSVTVLLQGTLTPGGDRFPLSADGSATVMITANGNYLYTWEGTMSEIYVTFTAEAGGTAAVLDVLVRAQ